VSSGTSYCLNLLGPTRAVARSTCDKEHTMFDILMLALGLSFFVLAVGYTYACERL
jgi:hypothetical protein